MTALLSNADRQTQIAATLLDHLLEGCQVIDNEFRYLYLNAAAIEQSHVTLEQLLGNRMVDVFPGIEQTPMFAQLRRTMSERVPLRMENEFCYADGAKAWFDLRFEPVPDGVAVVSMNITERRIREERERLAREAAESELRTNEAKLKGIMNAVLDPIFLKDAQGRWLFANTASLALLGKSLEEIQGKTDVEIYANPAIGQAILDNDIRIMASGVAEVLEETVEDINGARTYLSTKSPYCDSNGVVIGIAGVSKDITERNRIEASARDLAKSQAFETAVSLLPIGVAILEIGSDDVPRFNSTNIAFREIVGATVQPGSLFSAAPFKIFEPDRITEYSTEDSPGLRAARTGNTASVSEAHIYREDGQWRVIRGSVVPISPTTSANSRLAIIVIVDITQEREALTALRASEMQQKMLIEEAVDAFFLYDGDGRLRQVNRSACEKLEYSRDELLTMTIADIEVDFDLNTTKQDLLTRQPGSHTTTRKQYRRKNGTMFPVSLGLTSIEFPKERLHLAVVRDISEEINAKVAFEAFHAQLTAALASMTDAVFISDSEGRFLHFNDAFATFHKFPSVTACARTLGEYPNFLDVFLPDGTLAPLEQWAVPRALRGETVTNAIYGLRRKDTGQSWVGNYSFGPIRDSEGTIQGSVVTARDITEQIRLETQLRESEALLNAVFEGPGILRFVFELNDTGPIIVMVNRKASHIIEPGSSWEELTIRYPIAMRDLLGAARQAQLDGHAVTLDTELEDAKGKVWLRCAICPLDPLQNSNPRIVIEGIDISNQTRDQAALRTANERLSLVLNVASVAVWVTSADGSAMLEVTDSIKRIYGRSADEFRSTPSLWLDVVHPDDRNIAMRSLVDINVMGHSLSEYRIIRRDGEVRWVLDEKSLIRDASGNVVQLGGAVHDVTERREAEEALKQLNAELEARVRQRTDELARESEFSRSLLNSIPFGMAIIDKDCRVLFLNDRLAKQTGPDAIGKPCFMSLRHDHRQPEECPIKLGRKGQNTGSFEATGMISGRVVSITHTPIVFQGLDATLELYEDVSERSRAERLRKSRLEFLEESVTLSPQAFLRRALDEMCSHTESQLAFYLEVENSERLVMRAWSPVSLGETYDLLRTGIEYRVTEVESWAECIRLQQPVTRNDTDAAPVSQVRSHPHLACTRELVVPVVRGKRVVGIVAVRNRPQDYTDADLATVSFLADVAVELYVRRQQEEVIAEQRKLFDFVFERALAGFWDWTLQSGAMRMSERFKAVLGYKTEELPDTIEAWKCLIHPEDLEMVLERHRAIIDLRRDGTISFDLRYVHRNGSTVWVSWIGTVVENAEDGRPRRLVGCQIDITQTKHMEQALRATQEAAATANIAKGVFLANMSHEIRTPMNAVLGFTQLLLRNHETTTVQRRYLEIINRAGDHLLFLIDQILQIAKIESGHATLEENTVDVSQLLSDLRHFFASRVATKAFAFAVTSDAHCPRYIVTDEGKLRQILFNLIGNAIKFTELGRVTFHTAIKRDDTQAWITFEISDTGPGIAAQDLPRLFRKFEQTDTGRRTKQGTGLGLAISQEFAQLMGGGITLESAVGCGSRFTVTLPLRVGSRSDFRPLKRPRVVRRLRPFQEKIRALVVDDNTDNLSFAVGLLESVGFTTAQAINGRDAIDVYVNWHPHLILMDMRMPVLDGAEATRQIRAIPGGHAVKIIAVTANAFEEDKEAALKTGVNDFLRKPYREHELFEKISELLGVTYEYDDESAPSLAVAPRVIDDSVIREQLCDFPKDLRRQLLHAAIVADLDSFIQLLAKAKNFNATAAQALQFLAEGFDYKRIRALLELGDNDAG